MTTSAVISGQFNQVLNFVPASQEASGYHAATRLEFLLDIRSPNPRKEEFLALHCTIYGNDADAYYDMFNVVAASGEPTFVILTGRLYQSEYQIRLEANHILPCDATVVVNQVSVTGNLTDKKDEWKIKSFQSGSRLLEGSVRLFSGKKDENNQWLNYFFDFKIWGYGADHIYKCQPGDVVSLAGTLDFEYYKSRDGEDRCKQFISPASNGYSMYKAEDFLRRGQASSQSASTAPRAATTKPKTSSIYTPQSNLSQVNAPALVQTLTKEELEHIPF